MIRCGSLLRGRRALWAGECRVVAAAHVRAGAGSKGLAFIVLASISEREPGPIRGVAGFASKAARRLNESVVGVAVYR